jgi:hypothetical protein
MKKRTVFTLISLSLFSLLRNVGVTVVMSTFVLCANARADAVQDGAPITITVEGHQLMAVLNDSQTSRDFWHSLPQTRSMSRFGDRDYYATLSGTLPDAGKQQWDYTLGDIAYWLARNYVGILFSMENAIPLTPIIIMGKVTSDLEIFKDLGQSAEMLFEVSR